MKKHRSIRSVAAAAGLTPAKARRVKAAIEARFSAPKWMVWGTGREKNYDERTFAEVAKEMGLL